MNGNAKNWLGDTETTTWDPYEVWRQRILLPRLQELDRKIGTGDWHDRVVDAGQSVDVGRSAKE